MKTRFVFLAFLGVFAMASMSFRSATPDGGLSRLSIVKGTVSHLDHDPDWDLVNFGLVGYKDFLHKISAIEILDADGNLLYSVTEVPVEVGEDVRITWFDLNLTSLKIPDVFYIRVHVASLKNDGNLTLSAVGGNPAPMDPDETVLILKYP